MPPDTSLADPPVVTDYDIFLRTVQARRWADRLTARMEALSITNTELARRTGLSLSFITLLRQGRRRPSDSARLAICVALGADVAQVFPEPELRDFLTFVDRFLTPEDAPEAVA